MSRLALTALAACLFGGVFASSANASSFYNYVSGQPDPATIHFSCGTHCYNNFSIKSGDSASRPGKGGHLALTNVGEFDSEPSDACEVGTQTVEEHGEASLGNDNGYEWTIYAEDNSQVNGSPFAIKFGSYQSDVEEGPVGCH